MRVRHNNSESAPTEEHLSDTEIAAIVHADLRNDISLVRDTRQSHLNACVNCRTKVNEARKMDSETARLLHVLDVRPPAFDVSAIVHQGRQTKGRGTKRRGWKIGRYSAVAASLLVCALGAVAFALPTSSLGRAVKHFVGMDVPPRQPNVPPVPPAIPPAVKTSGVALSPTGPLTIEFRNGMPAALQVRYCDTTLATLSVAPGATTTETMVPVRYAVSNNKIRVTASGTGSGFILTLPEHTPRVYVVGDDTHPTITISAPPTDHVAHGCHPPINVPLSH